MSDLGGYPVLTSEVHIPRTGAWSGYLTLDTAKLPAFGRTVLTIGDLSLVGSVIRAGWDDHPGGALVSCVVRGGAGWRLPVTRRGAYGSDDGVRLRTVLQDLAAMSGEPYVAPPDIPIGTAYQWQESSALAPVHGEDILADLVTRGYLPTWRVDLATGATRFDAWPSIGPADGRGRIVSRDLRRGLRVVKLDTQVRAFLPGSTLESVETSRLVLHETSEELRAECYAVPTGGRSAGDTPTARRSLRRLVAQAFPWLTEVVSVAGAKGKGLAIRTASGLLHLAGGPDDPAVHRVGDLEDGGTFSATSGPLLYTGKDGKTWQVTGIVSGGAVLFTLVPITASSGKLVGAAERGSTKVTCG